MDDMSDVLENLLDVELRMEENLVGGERHNYMKTIVTNCDA